MSNIDKLRKLDSDLGRLIDKERADEKEEESKDFIEERLEQTVTPVLNLLAEQNKNTKDMVSVLNSKLDAQSKSFDKSIQVVAEAIKAVKIETPNVVVPDVKVPEVKVPKIAVPDVKVDISTEGVEKTLKTAIKGIKQPIVNVPEPVVNVNVPKMDFEWPEGDMSVKGIMELAGVDVENPLPVQLRDKNGKPVDFNTGGSTGSKGYKQVKLENTDGVVIGPATETKQDDIITAIGNGSDYALQVALGNITGVASVRQLSLNPSVGTSFEDVWCSGGTLVYPTAAESWEIVSSSANDTAGGTGARTVEITTLDANYVEQDSVTVTLNGTTAAAISGTHFRFVKARVKTWGSTGWNEGNLTIRVAGAGATRACILFDDIGRNISQDSHYTVPAGKTFYPASFFVNSTKDHDITALSAFRLVGEDGFQYIGNFGIYQNSLVQDFVTAAVSFPEKTDVKWIVKSNNTDVSVTVGTEGYLIDN